MSKAILLQYKGFDKLPMTERSDRSFAGISSGQTALLPHVIYNRYGQRLRLTQPDSLMTFEKASMAGLTFKATSRWLISYFNPGIVIRN